ncbi:alpha/beta hydrolase [Actinoplanes sp. NPDC026670]|uniref:alpha/beta hydrolase n=1 Tax=Actinoplanes sp. NPDC026670 TaxID=3154700 RepID=UPI0033ED37D9
MRRISIVILAVVMAALGLLGLRPAETFDVPAGGFSLRDCDYEVETGTVAADCGTIVVPENRRDPGSDQIALPVIRIRATGAVTGAPIFRLNGGPGATNLEFPQAGRLIDGHDVVLVGYRGVDGSRRLDCPEVDRALQRSADLAGADGLRAATAAFGACAERLTGDGVDLTGYSIAQRVDDLEAARVALGYGRINLLSSSAGTRTAMIYSWRYPASLERSAMISVNPPGHFVWDPAITDRQIGRYAELCRQDSGCSGRTPDLTDAMRKVAADVPDRWGPLRIKDGNVRVAGMYGMFLNGPGAAPLNAPTLIDAYLSGDPAALWALSVLGDLVLPTSFVWGEFASFGMIDAPAAERYYAAGGDHGSVLGNKATDLLWGGPGGFFEKWPDSPDNAAYRSLQPSDVPTLLIGGSLDFSTPAELATRELLPTLSRGQQVILPELGHTGDFWEHQPAAGSHLLTTFFDTGQVSSQFTPRPVDFSPAVGMSALGRYLFGIVAGLALLTVVLVAAMLLRVRRRAFGPRAGMWLRFLTPALFGVGGWCCAILLVWTAGPAAFIGSAAVAVPSVGLAVGLSTYAAGARDLRLLPLAVTVAAAVAGAAIGYWALPDIAALATTIVGAAVAANLALPAFRPQSPTAGRLSATSATAG